MYVTGVECKCCLACVASFFLGKYVNICWGGGGGGVSDGDGIEAAEKYCNVTSSSSY